MFRARAWSAANTVMMLAFAFSVVVQINDPDPWLWMAMYAAAAAVCLLAVLRRAEWWHAALVGAVALVWSATIAPRVIGKVPFASMFEEFEMKDVRVEESRELYGLLLIAAWMIPVGIVSRRSRAAPNPSSPLT